MIERALTVNNELTQKERILFFSIIVYVLERKREITTYSNI